MMDPVETVIKIDLIVMIIVSALAGPTVNHVLQALRVLQVCQAP